MRDRAWRRYKQDVKLLQRLHNIIFTYGWGHKDENGVYLVNPSIKSFIGSDLYCKFKTYTTDRHDSRYKTKYSPNKQNSYYRDNNKDGRRELDKVIFFKMLKEYGIK